MYIFEYLVYHLRPFGASSYSVMRNSSASTVSVLRAAAGNHRTEMLLNVTPAAAAAVVSTSGNIPVMKTALQSSVSSRFSQLVIRTHSH